MTNEQKRAQIVAMFGAYSTRLEKLYDDFILKLSQLAIKSHKSVKSMLEESPLFHFDDYPELRQELNNIFADYLRDGMLCYRAGITSGVALAFSHDSGLIGGFSVLSDKALSRVRDTASETFLRTRLHTKQGLNLSQLVWNYSSQAKAEFEVAVANVLSDGLKGGVSAVELARLAKQYLNNPDMMYRRYHRTVIDAQGNKRDIVKWRRRIVDDDGRVRFVEQPLEKVGMGHYRSARKNAERLMRTEINSAYHHANYERWQLEPFVIGIKIDLSPQHPEPDMCDDLKGRYPKDFLFAGWHPQCLCMSNPITIQGDEKKDFYRRLAAGEDMSNYVSPNRVQDVPDGFKKFVDDNHDKFVSAGEHGKLGYVWQDNAKYWRSQFSREELDRMGYGPTARKRIKTEEEKADIQARWDERKEQNRLTITTGNNVLRVAEDLQYEDTYRERVQLRRALKDNRLIEVRDITSRLAKQIATINREAAGWTDIPNPRTWLQTFTLSKMQAANSAIQKTFQRWTWNFDTRDSLSFLKGRLEREMRVVESSKYATKDVAKAAFEQRLKLIEKRTQMLDIKENISHELSFASTTRSPIVKKLDNELRALFADNNADLALMRSKASELRKNVARLEAESARRTKSGASATATIPSATMSDEQIRNEMVKLFRSWGEKIDASKITVVDGQVHLTEVQHMVISEHVKVLAAERKQVWSRGWDNGYIQTSNSFKINGALRDVKHDGMFKIIGKDIRGHPNLSIAADKYGKTLNADDIKTIATLDRIIGKNSLPFPVRLVRNVGWEGIEPLFGGNIDISGLTRKEIAAKLSGMKLNKLEADRGFMSTSTNPRDNVFKSRKYQIQIEVPAGKPIYITSNLSESEAVLGRASELILKEVRYNKALDIVEVLVRLA